MLMKYCLLILIVFSLFSPLFASSIFAQSVPGIAYNITVADTVKPGDILVVTEEGIKLSTVPFDARMYGVVVEFPVLSAGEKTEATVSVLSSGRAAVNVTAAFGEIKAGDLITSSDKPGVGQKASVSGYILGKALAGYNDTSKDGQITVLVDIGLFAPTANVSGFLGSLLTGLSSGFTNTQNFPLMLRYVSAALIGIVTFVISAFSFVRFMRNGLEAMGRNPLAKKTIVAGMMLNAGIIALLSLAGFGIAAAIVAF